MSQTRDIQIGLIKGKSTAPVAHEAKRDSRQEAKKDISAPESKTQLVLTTRPEPSFHRYLNLPPALLLLIAVFWDQKDLHQCNRALVGLYYDCFRALSPAALRDVATYPPLENFLHRQFAVVPRQTKLLRAVIDADYKQAQAAVDRDPDLMFEPVSFRYRDGSSERISPLQYAFKVYDTYMWKLFYEKIKEYPRLVTEFLKQERQTKHIDLGPLFEAYGDYASKHYLCFAGGGREIITIEELNAAWLKLGATQRLILPVHMLQEFSRAGNTQNHYSPTFDVTAMPPPSNCWVYDYRTGGGKALSSIISDRGWGSSFSFLHGSVDTNGLRYPSVISSSMLGDWATLEWMGLRRLFKVRVEDLTKQISLLSHTSYASPELETQSSSSASRVVP